MFIILRYNIDYTKTLFISDKKWVIPISRILRLVIVGLMQFDGSLIVNDNIFHLNKISIQRILWNTFWK